MSADSRLDEYRVEAERLSEQLAAAVPADLIEAEAIVESAVRHDVGADAASPAWWQVRRVMRLIEEQDASAVAAESVAAVLIGDGWDQSRVRESEEGRRIVDGYRKDDWYVELTWITTEPGMAEAFSTLVVSPTTTLGAGG